MGMVCGMQTLDDEAIRKVIADPPLVWRVLAPDDPDIYAEARAEADGEEPPVASPTAAAPAFASAAKPGFFACLFGLGRAAPPPAVRDVVPAPVPALDAAAAAFVVGPTTDCYLDKAWHGIHFLLTGTAWEGAPPLNFVVAGGVTLEEIDAGYGPPRLFTSAQVQAIAAALAPVDIATLRARFDPAAMARLDIYPQIWERDGIEALDYCLDYYAGLKEFVAAAAARGQGIVVSVS